MEQLTVVKIGGGVLENQDEMASFLDQFVAISGKKLLVHGGGRSATKIMERLGITVKMAEGRRITDAETLDVVTMVYGGLINKKTVAELQSRGCNAIGLCGADAGLIIAKKRPVISIDYGFVGDIESIDHDMIIKLTESGLVPVFSPLTISPEGQILNTNADAIASGLAIALSCYFKVALVYCFEKPGVLANPDDNQSILSNIDHIAYQSLKSKKIINNGMIPKLDNCFKALSKGVEQIYITNGQMLGKSGGTKICL